jgi:hypothetical protein
MGISPSGRVHVRVDDHGDRVAIDPAFIQPLPTPDPHKALKDAVIEAAKVWRQAQRTEMHLASAAIDLLQATDALEAALAPPKPDPVEVFTNAIRPARCVSICARQVAKLGPHCYGGGRECHNAIASGLAAVDAARGAQ